MYSNHITDGIKVESRIIRYSQRGLLKKATSSDVLRGIKYANKTTHQTMCYTHTTQEGFFSATRAVNEKTKKTKTKQNKTQNKTKTICDTHSQQKFNFLKEYCRSCSSNYCIFTRLLLLERVA